MAFSMEINHNKALHKAYLNILVIEKQDKYRLVDNQALFTLSKIILNIKATRELFSLRGILPRSYFSDSNYSRYKKQYKNIENAISSIKFNNAEQERLSYVINHMREHKGDHIYNFLYKDLSEFKITNSINSAMFEYVIIGCINQVFYNIKKPLKITLSSHFNNMADISQMIKWYVALKLEKTPQFYCLYPILFIEQTILKLSKYKKCKTCNVYYDIAISRLRATSCLLLEGVIKNNSFRIESKLLFDKIINRVEIDAFISMKILQYII